MAKRVPAGRSPVKFTEGETVALFSRRLREDEQISKVQVCRVRADGKFFIRYKRGGEVVESEQMWSPTTDGARQAGRDDNYARSRIEKWKPGHDKELAEQRATWLAKANKGRIRDAIDRIKADEPTDRAILADIINLLGNRGYTV